jgi:hypothetical protein
VVLEEILYRGESEGKMRKSEKEIREEGRNTCFNFNVFSSATVKSLTWNPERDKNGPKRDGDHYDSDQHIQGDL